MHACVFDSTKITHLFLADQNVHICFLLYKINTFVFGKTKLTHLFIGSTKLTHFVFGSTKLTHFVFGSTKLTHFFLVVQNVHISFW